MTTENPFDFDAVTLHDGGVKVESAPECAILALSLIDGRSARVVEPDVVRFGTGLDAVDYRVVGWSPERQCLLLRKMLD